MKAYYQELKEQAEWTLKLALRIHSTVIGMKNDDPNSPSRHSGTIHNLCPELSKAASKLKQMNEGGYRS